MNKITLILLGAAVGGVGAYFYEKSAAAAAVAGSPQAQNLTNAATNYLNQISNPNNTSDPAVQGYVSVWNQLHALGATGGLPSLATLQSNYNSAQQNALKAGA